MEYNIKNVALILADMQCYTCVYPSIVIDKTKLRALVFFLTIVLIFLVQRYISSQFFIIFIDI